MTGKFDDGLGNTLNVPDRIWANKPSHCRSAHRSGYPEHLLNRANGFRVAMNQ